jgi:hypothetical protein
MPGSGNSRDPHHCGSAALPPSPNTGLSPSRIVRYGEFVSVTLKPNMTWSAGPSFINYTSDDPEIVGPADQDLGVRDELTQDARIWTKPRFRGTIWPLIYDEQR